MSKVLELTDAYALLVDLRLLHILKYEHPAIDRSIEALREALAQQPELSNASKSEQLLASHDHALRAEFQRTKAALAQQGEQQPWRNEYDEGYAAGRMHGEMIGQEAKAYKEAYFKLLEQVASLKALEPAPPIILQAAPAAQPLTDEQIKHIYMCVTGWSISDGDPLLVDFARAIEAAHGIGADK